MRLKWSLPLAAAFVLVISVPVAGSSYETPEEAVREYLAGVAQADIERVLGSTALDEVAERYRFDQHVERLNAFTATMPGPVHSTFFADVQQADWTGRLLWQTRMLVYSLLAPDALTEALEGMPLTDVDGAWAASLVSALDETRLSSLAVAEVAVPAPAVHDSDRNQENSSRMAGIYGADEWTERVALLDFEGDTYAVGFTLVRYGDDWKVLQQNSALSGLPWSGNAQPMTGSEFTDLTSE